MPVDPGKLEQIEAKMLATLNELYAFRLSLVRGLAQEADPFVPLKAAAKIIKKSPKATRTRAEKIPGCLSWDGGRWMVNMDLIQVLVAPPKSRRPRKPKVTD